ncbi:hypothetical protein J7E88_22575 [Streptomyces sp. ISL-10]|uniref:hypothetical protein n=1 Tax=Streptomyces sp. ISL-10 TaxID=2819172 RepID=UPI001BEAFC11|nr:hypothetical protein [Streptomyces sp. ISL-10]MBT2368021.1 hypothetical protein [Streptomyces sp. ISL-10]
MASEPKRSAVFAANALETVVVLAIVAAAFTGGAVLCRLAHGRPELWQVASALIGAYGAATVTRAALDAIAATARYRLHVAAGCVDCLTTKEN